MLCRALSAAAFAVAASCVGVGAQTPAAGVPADPDRIVQSHAVFTVAEGKRLIAKAVVRMPIVEKALRDGMVIVCKGTTNTYVAEELLGRPVPHGPFVIGHITPQKGGGRLSKGEPMRELVLVKGKPQPDLTLDQALQRLGPGDVVIKGGNALDYAEKVVGVWNASASGGTSGRIVPLVAERKAHLIIPIGLEKQVAGRVRDIAARTTEGIETLGELPRLRILAGEIVTEIEALRILANVDAFQASAGGIGGAEGAVWLVWRGRRGDVEKARAIAASVQGEEPFIR